MPLRSTSSAHVVTISGIRTPSRLVMYTSIRSRVNSHMWMYSWIFFDLRLTILIGPWPFESWNGGSTDGLKQKSGGKKIGQNFEISYIFANILAHLLCNMADFNTKQSRLGGGWNSFYRLFSWGISQWHCEWDLKTQQNQYTSTSIIQYLDPFSRERIVYCTEFSLCKVSNIYCTFVTHISKLYPVYLCASQCKYGTNYQNGK